eukprot:jgi/Tetstr1/454395/TSEL_004026.t1
MADGAGPSRRQSAPALCFAKPMPAFVGSFRNNVSAFMEEFTAAWKGRPSPKINIALRVAKLRCGSHEVPLRVYVERVRDERSAYCDQCRCIGWQAHPVSNVRFHFVIPAVFDSDPWETMTPPSPALLLERERSPFMPVPALEVFEDQTHLLHGNIHINGFGHLMRMNRDTRSAAALSGQQLMGFWDEVCDTLRARLVSTEDVSHKGPLELRILYPAIYGHTWYGRWGYSFGRSAYNLSKDAWQQAVDLVRAASLELLLQDFAGVDSGVVSIIELYSAPRAEPSGSPGPATLGELLRFMLVLCNDDGRAAKVLGVPYQPPPPPPPLFTSPTAAPGAPVQGRKGARPPAKKTMPGRGGRPADEAAVRANRRGVRTAAGLQPKKEEVREEAKTGARAEAVGREKGVEDGTAAEMGAAPVKVEEKGAPFRGEAALLAASGRTMRGAASEALRAMRGQLTTKAYTRQGEGGCERAAAEGKDGHTKAAAAVAGQAKERGEGKGKGTAPPQRKAAAIPQSKPQPRCKPKVPEGSVLPEGSLQIENKKLPVLGATVFPGRWSESRMQWARRIVVDTFKEHIGTGWISREAIREEVHQHIGDTGLLDFLMKIVSNQNVDGLNIYRTRENVSRKQFYLVKPDKQTGRKLAKKEAAHGRGVPASERGQQAARGAAGAAGGKGGKQVPGLDGTAGSSGKRGVKRPQAAQLHEQEVQVSDKTKDGEHAASSSVGAADSQKGGRRVAMPNGWGMGLSDTKVLSLDEVLRNSRLNKRFKRQNVFASPATDARPAGPSATREPDGAKSPIRALQLLPDGGADGTAEAAPAINSSAASAMAQGSTPLLGEHTADPAQCPSAPETTNVATPAARQDVPVGPAPDGDVPAAAAPQAQDGPHASPSAAAPALAAAESAAAAAAPAPVLASTDAGVTLPTRKERISKQQAPDIAEPGPCNSPNGAGVVGTGPQTGNPAHAPPVPLPAAREVDQAGNLPSTKALNPATQEPPNPTCPPLAIVDKQASTSMGCQSITGNPDEAPASTQRLPEMPCVSRAAAVEATVEAEPGLYASEAQPVATSMPAVPRPAVPAPEAPPPAPKPGMAGASGKRALPAVPTPGLELLLSSTRRRSRSSTGNLSTSDDGAVAGTELSNPLDPRGTPRNAAPLCAMRPSKAVEADLEHLYRAVLVEYRPDVRAAASRRRGRGAPLRLAGMPDALQKLRDTKLFLKASTLPYQ